MKKSSVVLICQNQVDEGVKNKKKTKKIVVSELSIINNSFMQSIKITMNVSY